jgi:flagellar basal body L-ring protein FlgH
MKGGIRKKAINPPLINPIKKPDPMPTKRAKLIDPVDLMIVAAKHALNPILAPTDKSNPAVRITIVKPEANKNSNAVWRKTFSTLFEVRKASEVKDKVITMSASAISRNKVTRKELGSADQPLSC